MLLLQRSTQLLTLSAMEAEEPAEEENSFDQDHRRRLLLLLLLLLLFLRRRRLRLRLRSIHSLMERRVVLLLSPALAKRVVQVQKKLRTVEL